MNESDAPADLAPFVAKLVEVQIVTPYVRFRVPDGCFLLGIGVNRALGAVRSFVMTPWSHIGEVQVQDGWQYLEARFRWGAGPAFLRCDPRDLCGGIATPLDIFGKVWERALDQITGAEDAAGMKEAFTSFLRQTVPDRHALKPAVLLAVGQLERSDGNLRVEDLANAACISPSQLRRLFAAELGVSPRASIRLSRLWHAMDHGLRTSFSSWSQTAAEAGYCDQAHLVDEFRRFTSSTPTQWQAGLKGVDAGRLQR